MSKITEHGFFVKIREAFYIGPYDTLKIARNNARDHGSKLEIYHGFLRRISDTIIDDKHLYLIPKCQKG